MFGDLHMPPLPPPVTDPESREWAACNACILCKPIVEGAAFSKSGKMELVGFNPCWTHAVKP